MSETANNLHGPRTRPMVLVVDDHQANLHAMSVVLERLDADIEFASSGAEALEASKKREPAVVLLDVQMPEMDGYETAVRLLAQEGRAHVPIIIVTAKCVEEEDIRSGYESGAIDYLTKPFVPDYVRAKVSTFLQLYRLRHDLALKEQVEARNIELRTVLDMVPTGVAITDEKHQIQMLNARAADHLSLERAAASGLSLSAILPAEIASQPAAAELRSGKIPRSPILYCSGEGFYRLVVTPLRHGGAIASFLAITEDITDKKRDRDRMIHSERMASVGVLAAGVAHEVNNPLGAVMINLEFAISELDAFVGLSSSDRLRGLTTSLGEARSAAQRVKNIVQGLRTFSRSGEIRLANTSLKSVIRTAVAMSANELKQKADVTVDCEAELSVYVDESRLVQVLVNLVVNAAQAFTSDSRGKITLRTRAAGSDQVLIEVTDNGPGITEEVQAKLFEPFFTTKAIGEGTGLGLPISDNLVREMGGTLTFETELHKGTTFRVLVPQADSGAPEVVSARPTAIRAKERISVALIDDDSMLLASIARALSTDFSVSSFSDAQSALAELKSGAIYPDILVCDLMMPGMSGIEFAQALARDIPDCTATLLFMTGGAVSNAGRDFLDDPAVQCIQKPFGVSELKVLLHNLAETRTEKSGGGG